MACWIICDLNDVNGEENTVTSKNRYQAHVVDVAILALCQSSIHPWTHFPYQRILTERACSSGQACLFYLLLLGLFFNESNKYFKHYEGM